MCVCVCGGQAEGWFVRMMYTCVYTCAGGKVADGGSCVVEVVENLRHNPSILLQ